jgi:hypothetical protein
VPASLVIPAGETSVTFHVATRSVSNPTRVTITATFGDTTRTAQMELQRVRATLSHLTLNPTSLIGGASARGTLFLTAPAPREGMVVQLESQDVSVAGVPATVRIPANATSAAIPVTTRAVGSLTSVTIAAHYEGTRVEQGLVVNPPSLATLALRPNVVRGARVGATLITLTSRAPAGGLRVTLESSHPSVVSLPAEVVIPEGRTGVTVPTQVSAVKAPLIVVISAQAGDKTLSATLRLLEVP